MNGLTGMEKFSHLEDKIYLTIEFAKRIREEKEKIEQETSELRREAVHLREISAQKNVRRRATRRKSKRPAFGA